MNAVIVRRALAGWALLAVVLAILSLLAPAIGLPLIALVLLVSITAVLSLASTEIERDVIHMALIGAVAGGLLESFFLGRDYWWHGLLFGLLVGALVGDEVQLSRRWAKLARQAREEARWWQKLPRGHWLPTVAGGLCLLAIVGALLAVVLSETSYFSRITGLRPISDLLRQIRMQRMDSTVVADLGRVWFAIVPLAMSIALSRFASKVKNHALLVDGLLRRVAILQCAALLMLAVDVAQSWFFFLEGIAAAVPKDYYDAFIPALAGSLRLMLLPMLFLMLSQVFLGKRMLLYWRSNGWLVALGMLGLTSVFIFGLLLASVLQLAVA